MSNTDGEVIPEWVTDEATYWRIKYESKKEQYEDLQEQYRHLQFEFTSMKMSSGPGAGSVVNENPDPANLFGSFAQYIQVFLAVIGGVVFLSGFVAPIGEAVQVLGGAVGLGSFATFLYHEWRKREKDEEDTLSDDLQQRGIPQEVVERMKNQ